MISQSIGVEWSYHTFFFGSASWTNSSAVFAATPSAQVKQVREKVSAEKKALAAQLALEYKRPKVELTHTMCVDCHTLFKLASLEYGCRIQCKDRRVVHVFERGEWQRKRPEHCGEDCERDARPRERFGHATEL